jgi:uncharacterized membrane protein YheB (UPF0754 family)
MEML